MVSTIMASTRLRTQTNVPVNKRHMDLCLHAQYGTLSDNNVHGIGDLKPSPPCSVQGFVWDMMGQACLVRPILFDQTGHWTIAGQHQTHP